MSGPESQTPWNHQINTVLGKAAQHHHPDQVSYQLRRRGTEDDEVNTARNTIFVTVTHHPQEERVTVDAQWQLLDGEQAVVHKEGLTYQVSPDGESIDFMAEGDHEDDPSLTIYGYGLVLGIIDQRVVSLEYLQTQEKQQSLSA